MTRHELTFLLISQKTPGTLYQLRLKSLDVEGEDGEKPEMMVFTH